MALPSNHRWIAVGKLSISNRTNAPHYAPEFTLQDLIHALSDRIARNDTHRQYSKESRLMWCADLNEDNEYHRLILQAGDKNTTGVSFYHFQELTSRDIDKEEDEGSHYASHILIKKTPDATGRNLILIEKVPGIYLSSIKGMSAKRVGKASLTDDVAKIASPCQPGEVRCPPNPCSIPF
ncbi:MAG: hypothetical protein Q4P24_15145 [Rhodobacterales bacterium]|nr:hypothetical protein [Rhodobacterales bacterium]